MVTATTMVSIAPGQAAANAPPLKDERLSDQAEAFQGQDKANEPNSTDTAAQRKAWKNLQARCLLAGFSASLIDGDDGQPLLILSRWALCKGLNNLAEAEAWVARVGGTGRSVGRVHVS